MQGDVLSYLSASGIAAVVNFPLWKAATIGQSGFSHAADGFWAKMRVLFGPPYKGVAATMFGMTWARAAIFYFSDAGKDAMLSLGASKAAGTALPAIGISTAVQIINQPIVRGTVTIQDPSCKHPNLAAALVEIYRKRGAAGLWHGTSAAILKTVPKYVTAVGVKDIMANLLPPPTAAAGEPGHQQQVLACSAVKSICAGVAGATLTNPLDVIRNEMFKTEHGLVETFRMLMKREGLSFVQRGIGRNMVAVAAPIGMTIFLTDAISDMRNTNAQQHARQPPATSAGPGSSLGGTGGGGSTGGGIIKRTTGDAMTGIALAGAHIQKRTTANLAVRNTQVYHEPATPISPQV